MTLRFDTPSSRLSLSADSCRGHTSDSGSRIPYMLRLTSLAALLLLTACQSSPRGENEDRFYSYVDAQGNLVTVEADSEGETGKNGGKSRDGQQTEELQQAEQTIQERATGDSPEAGNKDFMEVSSENYQTPGEAEERMREEVEEDETDRFVSYRGPEGEVITRPLNMKAEREAAEQRKNERAPEFERLPEGERYKEGTSRVPADCCRHLISGVLELEEGSNFNLRFRSDRVVHLGVKRPARVLRLGPGVGAVEVQSYIRDQGYLAPRLLMLNEEGMPVLKVNSLFTRNYPETWARYGYMDGWVERSREFAYVVFYLPYARVGEGGLELDSGASEAGGDHRRAVTGELAVTGRVQRTRAGQDGE